MTNEERDFIARFIARVGGQAQSGSFLPGSVPSAQPALPPIDREADAYIADQFQRYPEARYRITQMAAVQEAAIAELNSRLQQANTELQSLREQQSQAQPQRSGGFLGGLFGGGSSQPQARPNPWGQAAGPGYAQPQYAPPPQYPPNYQPGMFGRGGSGFLGSALTTAAGVAGGMVLGNALVNAFEGHHDAAAMPSGGGFFGGNDAISDPGNTAFDGAGSVPASDPTAGFGGDQGGVFDQGGSFDSGSSFDSGGGFDSGGSDFDNT